MLWMCVCVCSRDLMCEHETHQTEPTIRETDKDGARVKNNVRPFINFLCRRGPGRVRDHSPHIKK